MLGSLKHHFMFSFFWPQIAVLITNGQSDDPVDGPAKAVTDSGISLFAVGELKALYLCQKCLCCSLNGHDVSVCTPSCFDVWLRVTIVQ